MEQSFENSFNFGGNFFLVLKIDEMSVETALTDIGGKTWRNVGEGNVCIENK